DLARPTANPPLLPSECTELGDECLLPYPNSAFLREDESTPSGRRVAPPARLEGIGADLDEVARADGFSRVSPLVTRLPGGVSAEGLPSPRDRVAAYAASTADDAPIFVVLADPTSPRYGERVPYFAEAFASTEDPDEALLVITPLEVLEPAARYAVVVTSRVRDRCGQPSAPNAAMRALLANERPAGEPGARWDACRDLLFLAEVEPGLSPCAIAYGWDVCTSPTHARPVSSARAGTPSAISASSPRWSSASRPARSSRPGTSGPAPTRTSRATSSPCAAASTSGSTRIRRPLR